MRGVAFRCETLSSHFVCPSCSRRIAKDGSFNGSSRYFRSADAPARRKAFSTQTSIPARTQRLARSKWAPPRLFSSQTRSITEAVTQAPWGGLEDMEDGPDLRISGEMASMDGESLEGSSADARYDAVMRTLIEGHPDCVLEAFLDPLNYDILFRSLPAPTFAEAFRILNPEYFATKYIKVYRHFHRSVAEGKGYKSLRKICDVFFNDITKIAYMRRKAGHALGIDEYIHLLDCARSIGNAYMAREVWGYMKQDGVEPNLTCFNYFMEATVWDMAYFSKEKWNLRVTPFNMQRRRQRFQKRGFQGYSSASNGILYKTRLAFVEMAERGIEGDEHTFINLLISASRVGHMKKVREILKELWNVDVELLSSAENKEDIPPVTQYDAKSPLHPTSRLLQAVAHAFCINHDFPSALQLVDFISQNYNIPIPQSVWFELFEWAFVLSIRRTGPDAYENNPGKIPTDAVSSVFEMMTSAPYSMQPTMPMYNLLMKKSWNKQSLWDALHYMREGLTLYNESVKRRDEAAIQLSIFHDTFHKEQQYHTDPIFNPLLKDYYTLCREYTILQTTLARDSAFIERWVRLLIAGRRHWTNRHRQEWVRRHVPNLIYEWKIFYPKQIFYKMDQGIVSFPSSQLADEGSGKDFVRPDVWDDICLRERGEMVKAKWEVEMKMRELRERSGREGESVSSGVSEQDPVPDQTYEENSVSVKEGP